MAGLVEAHPAATFIALAYGLSWAIWFPVTVAFARNPNRELTLAHLLPGLLGAYGPTSAALVLTGLSQGKEGIRRFLRRYLPSRASSAWLAVAFMLPAAVYIFAILIRPLAGAPIGMARWDRLSVIGFLAIVLSALPFGPLGEEGGWRGYLLPALQRHRSALASGLIVGFVWTGWHFPMFWVPGAALPNGVTPGVSSILLYLAGVTSAAVVATALYNGSRGSLLVAVTYHLAINVWPQLLGPVFGTDALDVARATRLSGLIASWIVVVGLVILFGHKRLSSREPVTLAHASTV